MVERVPVMQAALLLDDFRRQAGDFSVAVPERVFDFSAVHG